MSFRILNPAPQYFLLDGRVNAGGKLWFYETDLTTPKSTWSDESLTTLNSNPVIMDAAGRTLTDVWGDDTEYGVVMTNSADVVIWTRNNVRADQDAALTIPALETGKFLTNDGAQLTWEEISQLPDMTGTAGNILYSDGALAYWAAPPAIPEPPEPDIVVGTSSFEAGTSDVVKKYFAQWGTGSAPASGTKNTSASVSFPTNFGVLAHVSVSITSGSVTPAGGLPSIATTGGSVSGFTATFYSGDEDNGSNADITSPVNFTWMAWGTKT